MGQLAHNAGLVRVARGLEAMVTTLERYQSRDPLFDVGAYSRLLSRVWLDVQAARAGLEHAERASDLAAVTGVARRTYTELPAPLLVQPVAAQGWVTDSGFVGITVHLWSPTRAGLVQATVTRPSRSFGADPAILLRFGLSEYSALRVSDLAHRTWILSGAKLSADGRLSLHRELHLASAPPMAQAALKALHVDGFPELLERVREQGSPLAFFRPARFGTLHKDRKRARASLEVTDRAGRRARLQTPARIENRLLLDNLAQLSAGRRPRPSGLIVRALLVGGELALSPVGAVFDVPVRVGGRGLPVWAVHLSIESLEGAVP